MATTALFIIDIQNDLATDPKTQIPYAERIREAGDKILSAARRIVDSQQDAQPSPVLVFVQHEEKPEDGPLIRGSDAWGLVFEPRADCRSEMLVHKNTRMSCSPTVTIPAVLVLLTDSMAGDTFQSNPDLASTLKGMGIDEVVAFGIQSECCVESTCNGALAAGFKVTLLSGAHSTYDVGGKTAVEVEKEVEERLRAKGARIVDWKDAVAGWERTGSLSCSS
ncbi:Isochorismatase hydrolase [Canariomyces notabilis]|uniref:Isochorismatase hydrolase n=1 Tax=Canariomyces notabilis TaxID=2074819 RepID=A0AAN6TF08_9PEZI|nr:Isochorismatase hydrolase [Canariomyces arenarius]